MTISLAWGVLKHWISTGVGGRLAVGWWSSSWWRWRTIWKTTTSSSTAPRVMCSTSFQVLRHRMVPGKTSFGSDPSRSTAPTTAANPGASTRSTLTLVKTSTSPAGSTTCSSKSSRRVFCVLGDASHVLHRNAWPRRSRSWDDEPLASRRPCISFRTRGSLLRSRTITPDRPLANEASCLSWDVVPEASALTTPRNPLRKDAPRDASCWAGDSGEARDGPSAKRATLAPRNPKRRVAPPTMPN
mmetsp:Transcript_12136/g.34390  ORF Transcript_12136/g.34390 Transcript_12136/m.34390 type:complete len:243 (-) Transcript_12136:336-1064(-)